MKKIVHIFLLTIYLPAALGVGFNVHYCGGEVESVNVFAYEDGCICHDNEAGCCNDDWKYVKLDDNSQRTQASASLNITLLPLFVQPVTPCNTLFVASCNKKTDGTGFDPPIAFSEPAYLRYRSLII
ncbi:MAG: hypothetical protein ACHQF2_10900 [Flavobacteriales bacterium]